MVTDNIAVVRRFVEEVWNKGNFAVLGEVVSDRYIGSHPLVGTVRGLEGFKQHIQSFRSAFPDLKVDIDDVGMTGDRVFLRWTARGTHRGAFMGMPASNNKGQISGISIDRVSDGKIVEHHESFDSLMLFQIMGVVLPVESLIKSGMQKPPPMPRA